jgi:hypothetical protein
MEKHLVTLRGGRSDGEILAVDPVRLELVVTHDAGEKHYGPGEWGTDTCPPVVTRLVEFEVYRRVDADTFQAVEDAA